MTLPPFAAFLQIDTNSVSDSLAQIATGLATLAPPAGAIIVLPELWAQGINFHDLPQQCDKTPQLLQALQKMAAQHSCLLAGSLPTEVGNYIHNTLFVVDKEGIVGRHHKQQLFAPMAEPDYFQAANNLQPLAPSAPHFGGLICFDLRFPELSRQQVRWGTKMLLVCGQWPQARIQHWRTLLQARAIENQIYVVACNRVGEQQDIRFGGHSMVVAPDGTILAEGKEEKEGQGVDIDEQFLDQVRGQFNSISPHPYSTKDSGKILPKSELVTILARQTGNGSRVVFTNGCFDILHEGHVSYLEAARRQGDLLVVGLNNDASIRAIKGPDRPMNQENSRARVLAALGCVDYVVLFGEDTPLNLLTTLRPDVLVKGADWPLGQIVGAKEVLSWGGEVKTIEFVGNFSTTGLIEKIRNKL